MKSNTGQREGLAKVADNIATACMVGLIGGIVENKIGWGGAVTPCRFCSLCHYLSHRFFEKNRRIAMAIESLVMLSIVTLAMLGLAIYADKHRDKRHDK